MNVVLSSKWKHDEIAVKVSLPRWCESWQFHILVLYGRAKKCTKFLNTCVLPLVCSLDLLFGHNLVAVAVVVFLHSLITHYLRTLQSNLTEITNSRNEAVCFIVCNLDCSDIWWSYMHKINQSFKPIIYKKKIKPKYCYLMGYCLKGRCLLKFMFYGKQGYCVIFVRQRVPQILQLSLFLLLNWSEV